MRWQLILQFTAAFAVLFGFGWYTSAGYVDRPAGELVSRTASAEAAGVASNVAVEWERARAAHRSVAEAAAMSPVIASLGGAVTNAEARPGAIKAALEGVIALVGGRGDAALINDRGQIIGATGQGGMELEKTDAVKDGASGASSARAEIFNGAAKLVAAAPIHTADGNVRGVLVIATPLDDQRLAAWNGQGPIGTGVALVTKDALVASTVKDKKNQRPQLQAIGRTLTLDNGNYISVPRDLPDDAGGTLRAIGLAREGDLGSRIVERVRFLVLALGVLTILVMLVGLMLAPLRDLADVPAAITEEGDRTEAGQPLAPLQQPQPVMVAQALETLDEDTHPLSTRGLPIPPQKQAAKAVEQPPVSPFSATLADTALRAGIEGLPLSQTPPQDRSEAFDEIANAVFSQPPRSDRQQPPQQERYIAQEDLSMPVQPDSHEDLPMPVEHMQLPGLREPVPPRGMGSPSFVRGNQRPSQPPPQQDARRTMPPQQPQPQLGRPVAPPPPQAPVQQPQRGPMYGGSAVPLPSSQPPPAARPPMAAEDPWRNPNVNQIANATTQPMQMPNQEPRRFTTTGDIPLPPSHNGRESQSQQPQLASARPFVAQNIPTGTPLPVPQPSSSRELPMPFDEEHYRVVYNEFVGSKARLGEAVDNITFEGFSSKLRSSEKELIDRHGCRAVRFQVLVKDRQVSLRPQLVR